MITKGMSIYDCSKNRPSVLGLARQRIAELERENAELRKIANLVRMKLTSGNGIPVERCTIRASEIAAIASEKENERG